MSILKYHTSRLMIRGAGTDAAQSASRTLIEVDADAR